MSTANAHSIGKQLVELCNAGNGPEAINTLYADNIVSIEPCDMGEMPARQEGIDAIRGKNQWWYDNHEVHSAECQGPFPHREDRFAVVFKFDVTNKPMNQRMKMEEVGLYTVKDGKIVQEEFFYSMEPGDCPSMD